MANKSGSGASELKCFLRPSFSFMRTRFSLTVILLLTLLAGGWSSVLAATLCPHIMAQNHSCCYALSMTNNHMAESGDAMDDMRMSMPGVESPVVGSKAAPYDALALRRPSHDCAHCLNHNGFPAAPMIVAGIVKEPGKDARAFASQPTSSPVSFTASSILYRLSKQQNAPPESSSPRHVLLNVFRI